MRMAVGPTNHFRISLRARVSTIDNSNVKIVKPRSLKRHRPCVIVTSFSGATIPRIIAPLRAAIPSSSPNIWQPNRKEFPLFARTSLRKSTHPPVEWWPKIIVEIGRATCYIQLAPSTLLVAEFARVRPTSISHPRKHPSCAKPPDLPPTDCGLAHNFGSPQHALTPQALFY